MSLRREAVGTIHFIGIGGIGMSGIAEIMHNLGYRVQGSDVAESANVQRLRERGGAGGGRPRRGQPRRGRRRRLQHGRAAGQSRARGRAGAPPAGGPPCGHAGRADALQARGRGRRHPRQDDDDGGPGGSPLRCRRARPHRRQRRHHQRLRHQRAPRPGRVDGGRGRRERRQLPAPAGRRSASSPTSTPSTWSSGTTSTPCAGAFRELRRAAALLRLRRPCASTIPRSRTSTPGRPTAGSSPTASARRPTSRRRTSAPTSTASCSTSPCVSRACVPCASSSTCASPCPAGTTSPTRWRPSRWRASSASIDAVVRRALAGLGGVKRRFTRTGTAHGVTVIDDYGHHPVEIEAVLATAQARARGRVVAVVQPHRYSRLHDLFDQLLHLDEPTPTRCSSRRSTPPARRRCRASTATPSSTACAGTATGMPAPRSTGWTESGRCCCGGSPGRATSSSAWAPAASRTGPTRCRPASTRCRAAPTRWPERGGRSRALPPGAMRSHRDAASCGATSPLAPLTWLRVGGPAELVFNPADGDELAGFLRRPARRRSRSCPWASAPTSWSATAACAAWWSAWAVPSPGSRSRTTSSSPVPAPSTSGSPRRHGVPAAAASSS